MKGNLLPFEAGQQLLPVAEFARGCSQGGDCSADLIAHITLLSLFLANSVSEGKGCWVMFLCKRRCFAAVFSSEDLGEAITGVL